MKRILACIDLADPQQPILETAAEMAESTGARLYVAHVVVAPEMATCSGGVSAAVMEDVGNRIRLARTEMDELTDHLQKERGLDVETLLLEGNRASESLLHEARRIKPDVIVLGAGRKPAEHSLRSGDTIQGVLAQTHWPLLVVPEAATGKTEVCENGRCDKAAAWFG